MITMAETQEVKQEPQKKKKKILIVIGKRKKAVARAFVQEGTGKIKINSTPIDFIQPN